MTFGSNFEVGSECCAQTKSKGNRCFSGFEFKKMCENRKAFILGMNNKIIFAVSKQNDEYDSVNRLISSDSSFTVTHPNQIIFWSTNFKAPQASCHYFTLNYIIISAPFSRKTGQTNWNANHKESGCYHLERHEENFVYDKTETSQFQVWVPQCPENNKQSIHRNKCPSGSHFDNPCQCTKNAIILLVSLQRTRALSLIILLFIPNLHALFPHPHLSIHHPQTCPFNHEPHLQSPSSTKPTFV